MKFLGARPQHEDLKLLVEDPDAVEGNLAEFDANGNPVDSGIDPDTKADKDPDAVENNLAKFDSSGNPVDSGLSTPNVSDAASKKHTQNTDQYLDFGGISQVAVADVKDAVTKKHSHSNLPLLETYTQTETNLADAVSKKHAQGSDTTLGNMAADINMNSHQVTGLSAPDAAGEAIRQTAKITESALESLIDGGSGGSSGGLSLIQNGSFEIVDSSTVPWCWEKVGSATLAQDTGVKDGYGGSLSLKVTSGGTNNEGAKYTFRHLKANTTYSVYVWMKATSGDTAKVWTTGGSSNLSITSTNTGGGYKSGSFRTDSTPTNVVLYVGSETSGDIVWFDALTVIEGPTPPDKYLPSPQPTVLEFQDFYLVGTTLPGLETLTGSNITKKYVYALDDTEATAITEPLGFNFSIPPNFDPSGFIMLECVGWAKTAAASKNIEYTYYYSPKKYGEDWDTAYSSLVSGDLALYSTQDYRDNLRFQLSINTAGLEAYDVVESKIARTAPSANNLSGDYYFEKLRIWIPRV
jgi:hypothetical protein